MNNDLKTRCIEKVRGYAAVANLMGHERKCKQPKSVEMFSLDAHDDFWGISDKCLYRSNDGQCYRYPFDHDAFMAFHVLTREKLPEDDTMISNWIDMDAPTQQARNEKARQIRLCRDYLSGAKEQGYE